MLQKNQKVLPYILHSYLYNDYILVVGCPDDGHQSDQNMLVKNNNMTQHIYKRALLVII